MAEGQPAAPFWGGKVLWEPLFPFSGFYPLTSRPQPLALLDGCLSLMVRGLLKLYFTPAMASEPWNTSFLYWYVLLVLKNWNSIYFFKTLVLVFFKLWPLNHLDLETYPRVTHCITFKNEQEARVENNNLPCLPKPQEEMGNWPKLFQE